MARVLIRIYTPHRNQNLLYIVKWSNNLSKVKFVKSTSREFVKLTPLKFMKSTLQSWSPNHRKNFAKSNITGRIANPYQHLKKFWGAGDVCLLHPLKIKIWYPVKTFPFLESDLNHKRHFRDQSSRRRNFSNKLFNQFPAKFLNRIWTIKFRQSAAHKSTLFNYPEN